MSNKYVTRLERRIRKLRKAMVLALNQFQDHEQYDEYDAEVVEKMRRAIKDDGNIQPETKKNTKRKRESN